jgi:membrane fusion protein, multidrug efflux system
VQRVPVKIVLDPNPALGTLVRPGMSVEATIDTQGAVPVTEPTTTTGTPAMPSDSAK